jgi:DNA-binding response OmpR family regulator
MAGEGLLMTKILIIEDDPEVRQTLIYLFEDEGYDVIVAEDGAKGVKKFASDHPDLVITDVFMPNQEGFQTIREILALKPEAKIIAASAGFSSSSADSDDKRDFYLRMAHQLGAAEIIPKPFEIDDLIRRVKRCLESGPKGGSRFTRR